MPTYTYKCKECEHVFDIRQGMNDDRLTDCPECDKVDVLDKIITGTGGFQLKGKGWFGNSKTTKGY
jgi:putative FmdB family regulatory protein